MMWHDGWGDWWMWPVMSVSMVAIWGLVIWGVATIVRSANQSRPPAGSASDPERILAERFARGEIDADEYHHRLTILRRSRTAV